MLLLNLRPPSRKKLSSDCTGGLCLRCYGGLSNCTLKAQMQRAPTPYPQSQVAQNSAPIRMQECPQPDADLDPAHLERLLAGSPEGRGQQVRNRTGSAPTTKGLSTASKRVIDQFLERGQNPGLCIPGLSPAATWLAASHHMTSAFLFAVYHSR